MSGNQMGKTILKALRGCTGHSTGILLGTAQQKLERLGTMVRFGDKKNKQLSLGNIQVSLHPKMQLKLDSVIIDNATVTK